ncbi:MAG: hypothetical protein EBR68_01955, partial [Synechococcaceae bacterium WB4_2_0811]|nr:hypothetical protein [Synechococcaceae bacterium WB4_2_0811]
MLLTDSTTASVIVGKKAAVARASSGWASSSSSKPCLCNADRASSRQPAAKQIKLRRKPNVTGLLANQWPTGHCSTKTSISCNTINRPPPASGKPALARPPLARSSGKALCCSVSRPVPKSETIKTGNRVCPHQVLTCPAGNFAGAGGSPRAGSFLVIHRKTSIPVRS